MPKFIGKKIIKAKQIENNASIPKNYIRLTYSQAKLLPPELIICSLNTKDRGSKGIYAKRWFNWFASIESILNEPKATKLMLLKANQTLVDNIIY